MLAGGLTSRDGDMAAWCALCLKQRHFFAKAQTKVQRADDTIMASFLQGKRPLWNAPIPCRPVPVSLRLRAH